MLRDLTAVADVRAGRIDVGWSWSDPAERPAFRLLRRRQAYPSSPADGLPVLDLERLLRTPVAPWGRVAVVRFLAGGGVGSAGAHPGAEAGAEGGLVQADVVFQWSAAADAEPGRVELHLWDAGSMATVSDVVEDVTRTERSTAAAAPWDRVEEVEVFHDPGGGETSAGVLTLSTGHADPATPDRLEWSPAGGPVRAVELDRTEVLQAPAAVRVDGPLELEVRWARVRRTDGADLEVALADPESGAADGRAAHGDILLHDRFSEDTGEWTRTVRVSDLTPVPEDPSYYGLYRRDETDPSRWRTEEPWRVRATATASYGYPARLYDLLPSLHRTYDEPTPEDRGRGALRRFLDVFGVGLDHLRSMAEALRSRHDVDRARDDFLPALASWIGWRSDLTAPLPARRDDIRFAPRIYRTVGTAPTLTALVGRATGWRCRAKEYVHNVCLTNAPETIPLWEIWTRTHDGTDFGPSERVTTVEGLDGRPALARDGGGDAWLVWHSDRSGRRELWFQRLDGVDPAPRRVMDGAPDDAPDPALTDEAPSAVADGAGVWVFWESDREGSRDLWSRRITGAGADAPERITEHAVADTRPAAVRDGGGDLRLFWQSERRGPSDVWALTHDGSDWGAPARLTGGPGRDADPAAAVDAAGRLWLVWRRDEGGSSRLWARIEDGGSWLDPHPLEPGGAGPRRDESPALVLRGTELWMLWHSDRSGAWEIWGRVHDGTDWGAPFRVTRAPDPDKEPALLVDGGDLRVFWRSRRRARRYRSRTVDTTDTELMDARGSFEDRLHFTYDTGRENQDRYARDVVGLFLDSEPASPGEFADAVALAREYVEPFRPVNVRLVWIPEGATGEEVVEIDHLLVDAFEDEVT